MSKAIKAGLLFTLIAVIVAAGYWIISKRIKATNSTANAAETAPATGTVVSAVGTPTTPTTTTTAPTTTVTPAFQRPVLPLSGDYQTMSSQFGVSLTKIAEFLTWDARQAGRATIEAWVPGVFIKDPAQFQTRFAEYGKLSDADYMIIYNSVTK